MKEQNLRVNIVNRTGLPESLKIEPNEVPSFTEYSLGDPIDGGFISQNLSGRQFRITGAQNTTGTPHVSFLDSPKYILASSNRQGNRRNIRGQRIRRLFFPRRLIGRITNLNLIEF